MATGGITELVTLLSRLPGVGARTATRYAYHVLRHDPQFASDLGKALQTLHARVQPCSRCGNFADADPGRLADAEPGQHNAGPNISGGAHIGPENGGPPGSVQAPLDRTQTPVERERGALGQEKPLPGQEKTQRHRDNLSCLCAICRDTRREGRALCVVASVQDLLAIEGSASHRGRYFVLHKLLAPLDGVGPEDLREDKLLAMIREDRCEEAILATPLTVEGEATASYLAALLQREGITVTRIAAGMPHGGELEYADQVTLGRAMERRTAWA